MRTVNHGGGCCGVNHLHDFSAHGPINSGSFLTLKNAITRVRPGVSIEVVLTDLQSQLWAPSLVKLGFKPVFRFRNANSTCLLTVFFFHSSPESLQNLPFSLDPEDAPREPNKLKEYPTVGDTVIVINPSANHYKQEVRVVSVERLAELVGVRLLSNLNGPIKYYKLSSLGK